MGRLTWKNPDGNWGLVHGDIRDVPGKYYGALCKLMKYEESGFEPEHLQEVSELYLEKCKQVNELERKLKQLTDKQTKKEVIYMQVTRDKYELPVAVTNSVGELAQMLGVSENSIRSAISHNKHDGRWSCYIKVELDEEG